MRDVHCHAHIREVKPIAQPDQGERDDMVQHQLPEIFPWLLQLQHEYQPLLRPVRRLQQVVCLEQRLVGAVREPGVHALGVEVPDWRAVHDVHAQGPEDGEVDGGVELLHEARLLPSSTDAVADSDGTNNALHQELAGEGEHDHVEGDEREVFPSFPVLCDIADERGQRVGAFVKGRIGVGKVDGAV